MTTNPPAPARLCCILLQRFNMMTLTGMLEPVRIANYLSNKKLYDYSFHAVDGDVLTSSNGLEITCQPLPDKLNRADLIIIVGSWGSEYYRNPELLSWLRVQALNGVRLCAAEMGAYLLARAGLLSGKRATVHWAYLTGFQEQFPKVEAVEQLYTIDGNILSCSGGTSGIDLMLHLVETEHGAALAGEVAEQMLHHPVRPETTRQRMTMGRSTQTLPAPVQATVDLIEAHISEPLGVPEIAERVGLSQRQLVRTFSKVMGCSVVQFALLMRLQQARVLLSTTEMGIREISVATGFNSLSHFAYAFKKCFGKRPSEYRHTWPEQEAEPKWPGSLARYLETLPKGGATG